MKRRGIENIASRKKKFYLDEFRQQCDAWTEAMEAWSQTRQELAGAAIEIDQLTVAREPPRAAATIAEFLSLTEVEARHLEQTFSHERPEMTTNTFGRPSTPSELSWSDEEWGVFFTSCGQMMDQYGYGAADQYYRPGEEGRDIQRV